MDERDYKAMNNELNPPLQKDTNVGCLCGIPYVETKKTDIPYDTDDNVYYTDILIHHCPKCGNIDKIEEY